MVYVISKDGQPLMPMRRHGKVRRLLKSKRAKVVRKEPFTIKLLFDTQTNTSKLNIGIDIGSRTIGAAVVDKNGVVLYASETQTRGDTVKANMSRRSGFRRTRRGRLRGRVKRFDKRKNSIKKGRYSVTLRSKFNSHIREINFIKEILPVTDDDIIYEEAKFDTHKITNPNVHGWQYQHGPLYGFANAKEAILVRDNYQCRNCNTRNTELHVHHIVPKSQGGGDQLDNLITLCKPCHTNLHKGLWTLNLKGKLKSKAKTAATHTATICSMFGKTFPNATTTYGYITKFNRQQLGLPKTHWIDAAVVASGGIPLVLPEFVFKKKHVQAGDYKQFKGKHSQIRIPTGKIQGFRKFDKVDYFGTIGFIQGKMSTGFATLMDINGKKISFAHFPHGLKTPKFENLKRISARTSCLCMKEKITLSTD